MNKSICAQCVFYFSMQVIIEKGVHLKKCIYSENIIQLIGNYKKLLSSEIKLRFLLNL